MPRGDHLRASASPSKILNRLYADTWRLRHLCQTKEQHVFLGILFRAEKELKLSFTRTVDNNPAIIDPTTIIKPPDYRWDELFPRKEL
jgi:hypothetical protein